MSSRTLPQYHLKMSNTGINYNEIYNNDYYVGQRQRMNHYHGTSRMGAIDYRKGAKHTDIAGLKSVDRQNLSEMPCGDAQSKFGIGFEVEKNRISRGAMNQSALFAGFERDGSCGYEAVTNILPLLPAGQWRNKVYSMMHDGRRVIEDSFSPSDQRCGGHVTISVEGMSGRDLFLAVRENAAILYALFRKRLGNRYCNANLKLDVDYFATRYCAIQQKESVLEFRLVSRFQSVKQMMRRYELFYEIINFSVNNPNGSFATLLKKVTPIIKSMYGGNMAKVNEVLDLAKAFNKYLKTGRVNREVINYIDPMRRLDPASNYDNDLIRNGWR